MYKALSCVSKITCDPKRNYASVCVCARACACMHAQEVFGVAIIMCPKIDFMLCTNYNGLEISGLKRMLLCNFIMESIGNVLWRVQRGNPNM